MSPEGWGEWEAAQRTFEAAIQEALSSEDPAEVLKEVLKEVATTQAEMGDDEGACRTVLEGEWHQGQSASGTMLPEQVNALLAIADIQLHHQKREQARNTLIMASDAARRVALASSTTLENVAAACARIGDIETARIILAEGLEITPRVEIDGMRGETLKSLADVAIRSGAYAAVPRIVEVLKPSDRLLMLARLAECMASRDRAASETILTDALAAARELRNIPDKIDVFVAAAKAHAYLGKPDLARTILDEAADLAYGIKRDSEENANDKKWAFSAIALARAALDDPCALGTAQAVVQRGPEFFAQVAATFGKSALLAAVEEILKMPPSDDQADMLASIAKTMAGARQQEEAHDVLRRGLQLELSVAALCTIATAQSETGDREGAQGTFAIAVKKASQDWDRAYLLYNIGFAQVAVGKLSAALEVARSMTDKDQKFGLSDELFRRIAEALAAAGEWGQALQVASESKSKSTSDRVLFTIARTQAQGGDWVAASKSAEQIRDATLRAEARAAILAAQALAGDRQAIQHLADINDTLLRDNTRFEIFEEQLGRGNLEGAKDAVGRMEDEAFRSRTLARLARSLVEAHAWEAAFETAQSITVNWDLHTPDIAEALVQAGDQKYWKTLLVSFGQRFETAYRACAILGQAFPAQVEAIAKAVIEFRPQV